MQGGAEGEMKTIKGPAVFLAQFAGDVAPFNNLKSIAGWAAKLGYKHGAFALRACASSAASLGRRSMASAPLPVSTSTCSAMISKPSTAAKRAMVSRCASRPSHHQVTDRALHFETP